jgi:hypothetical protein
MWSRHASCSATILPLVTPRQEEEEEEEEEEELWVCSVS